MSIFKYLPKSVVYLSRLIGVRVFNAEGLYLGEFQDIFVDYENIYPEVIAILIKNRGQFFFTEWDCIESLSYKRIVIKPATVIRHGTTFPKVKQKKVLTSLMAGQFTGDTVDYPPLGKVILDKQIVDISGRKVVRVNDIQLIRVGTILRVTHAAVGIRSLLRRIGYEGILEKLSKYIPIIKRVLLREGLINWKYVHAIPDQSIHKDVRLNLSNTELEEIHPADLADILEHLDARGREQIFKELDPETAAEVLSEVEPEIQSQIMESSDPNTMAEIIEHMSPDEAADLLSELSDSDADEIISNMKDDEAQEDIQDLLEYEEDTAGGLMTTDYFEIAPYATCKDALAKLKEDLENISTVHDIFVVNSAYKLEGICSVYDVMINSEGLRIADLMERDNVFKLSPETHWKEVANLMSKYNLINVPIVDEEDVLLGVVTVDDILPWLLDD